jgi:hypothetical protein
MTVPEVGGDQRQRYRPLLEEMLPLYRAFINAEPARLSQSHRRSALLAHGWYLRCERSVQALLILETNGFEEEAAPLRRTLIEHVLGLKWIAVEGNAVVDTVARGHARDAAKRLDALSTANWTSINLADLQEIIDDIGAEGRSSSSDHLLHFLQRLQRYGDVHTLPGYLAETALTHPTYQSAVKYFDVSSGEPQPLMEPVGAEDPSSGVCYDAVARSSRGRKTGVRSAALGGTANRHHAPLSRDHEHGSNPRWVKSCGLGQWQARLDRPKTVSAQTCI